MKAKKIWSNVTVNDLERTTKFYTELGFKFNGRSDELTSFLFGDDEFVIHFFTKEKFKTSLYGEIADLTQGNETVFSLSAESKDEVEAWAAAAKKAGGTIYAEPQDVEKGYFCGFCDPDGHKFNVLYWPGM